MKDLLPRVVACIRRIQPAGSASMPSAAPDFLDSILIVQLVLALEKEFSITVELRDLMRPDNWRSPEAVADLVRLRAAQPGS
jgi:hypothetical protein